MPIEDRKTEHLRICRDRNVQFREKRTGMENVAFKGVELEYKTLPEINRSEIDLSTEFFGKRFSAPLMVSGMTGGAEEARAINRDIAKAVQGLGLGMGVGSQRAMLEKPELARTYELRDVAPSIFLAGNIGIANLHLYSVERLDEGLERIGADALAIHVNALQEAVQPEGDTDFRGCLKEIKRVAKGMKKPVYVKEVGHGISAGVAKSLGRTGIKAIDVQGAGGTSWVGVEALREGANHELGEVFWDEGIPTVDSILNVKKFFKGKVIASGGIRSGLDIAKAIALGADLAGIALPVFKVQQVSGSAGVKKYLEQRILELKTAMFVCGAKNVKELKKQKIVFKNDCKTKR